jgi:hypothetical protein
MKVSKPQVIITRDILQQMLNNSDEVKVQHIVGHALVALFERQTEAEQNSEATLQNNTIGFTGVDGEWGAITAKFYIKNNKLSTKQVNMWLKKGKNGFARIAKYHSQLNEVAVKKAAEKAAKEADELREKCYKDLVGSIPTQ